MNVEKRTRKGARRPDYGALRAWLATTQQANDATLEEAQAQDARKAALLRYEAAAQAGKSTNEELEALYFEATKGMPVLDERPRRRTRKRWTW